MAWMTGWWSCARKAKLHSARLGGVILPFTKIVHTTDMHPDSWDALLKSWADNSGAANAAHFGIGRTQEQGTVQWVPITRNANHAGGSGHGVFINNRASYHPNLVAVGIEMHNAGGVRLVEGAWRWGESPGRGQPWMPHGAPLPSADVEPDPVRPGRGWHKPSEYQLAVLDHLLADLESVLAPMPPGIRCEARGKEKVPGWATPRSPRCVGHVSLDPDNRSDPWPLIMEHINR